MSTGPTYSIEFSRDARKMLANLPKKARAAIGVKIDSLATDPRPRNCVKLVDQQGLYRIRSGNYRVVYSIEDDKLIVYVVDIGDRKDVYERL